jgi:hypothetical protein
MGCCTSGSRVGCLTHNEHFIFVVSHRGLSFGAGMPRNPPNKDRTLVHLTKRNKGLLLAYAYEVLGEVGGQLNDKLNAALTDIWKKFTLPTKVAVPGDSRLENLTRDGLRSLCTVVGIRYERNDKTAGLVTKLQTFRDKERQQQADKRASRKRKVLRAGASVVKLLIKGSVGPNRLHEPRAAARRHHRCSCLSAGSSTWTKAW